MRARTAAIVGVALLGVATATAVAVGAPSSSQDRADVCRGTEVDPIPAEALARGVPATECALVGRRVTDGEVSVYVPPRGQGVSADYAGETGGSLTVEHDMWGVVRSTQG